MTLLQLFLKRGDKLLLDGGSGTVFRATEASKALERETKYTSFSLDVDFFRHGKIQEFLPVRRKGKKNITFGFGKANGVATKEIKRQCRRRDGDEKLSVLLDDRTNQIGYDLGIDSRDSKCILNLPFHQVRYHIQYLNWIMHLANDRVGNRQNNLRHDFPFVCGAKLHTIKQSIHNSYYCVSLHDRHVRNVREYVPGDVDLSSGISSRVCYYAQSLVQHQSKLFGRCSF